MRALQQKAKVAKNGGGRSATPGTDPDAEIGLGEPQILQRSGIAPLIGHDLSRVPLHPRIRPAIQAKLVVNRPGDRYEQEADHVAEQVMRQPENEQHACACGGSAEADRSCEECKKQSSGTASGTALQRQPSSHAAAAGGEAPASVRYTLSAPGRPLEHSTRRSMEDRFGVDFSAVRIHTDRAAETSARAVGARAYTVGRDIVFGPGEFAPDGATGRLLLAHELTHTIQQTGTAAPPIAVLQRQIGDPLEGLDLPDPSAVQSIVIDTESYRTRFRTVGGTTYDGTVTSRRTTFEPGDYILKQASGKDPRATWKIFNTDHTIYRGGLEFEVLLNGVAFENLSYTPEISLKVVSGLLPKLIDVEARIKQIQDGITKGLKDPVIVGMFEDIPTEQAEAFVKRLREEKVGDMQLLDKLDHYVDGEDNVTLHQLLSRLKLQAGGTKSAAALADAPQLAWHDVMGFFEQQAVFSVTAVGNGKYRIRYMGGVASGLYGSPEYSEVQSMGRRDRLNIMTSGIEVDADQPIIVHDYDNDRQVVLTAEDLIAYQHAGVRKFLQDIGTIAALATPAGAESVGAKVLQYGVQIASMATLIVDENKLNIKKWFPKWGPAIIDASEKIKLAIAVVGVAQLVQGGWKLFANLRRLRSARSAMDEKAVVSSAEELTKAERQAANLEANADKLLNQADMARKELGLAEEAAEAGQKVEGGAKAGVVEAPSPATPSVSPSVKTQVIDAAIGRAQFSGDFASLANRELADAAQNRGRLRLSKMPGYSVEVPIEGTDHFLARNASGGWCLFSGTPKGCGAITVAKTVDELFEEIGREVGTSKITTRMGSSAKVDIAKAVQDAKDAGFVGAAGEPLGVDLAVQPHSAAPATRKALGVSGKDVQSSHHGPTAALKDVEGYSRGGALTVLLPRATHKAFDDTWKEWSIAQRQAGRTQATVKEFLGIVDQAIEKTPGIETRTKGAMSTVLFNELYRDLGLQPDDLITLPYRNIK
ncbi:eCIS core domain-containing protein [Mycolicibacterium psychrotolerans]|uniref:eCIS core domain-containing protein n=1 Tax=Mycolicibacterium psychrotolerans TaxID=216929 RepID=A0A7I7MCH9_9MYCO|nr:DUF4157 domain-containing protein [Mycolicibacterium psychrotolerans]BBX69964.1 hypothetical protein MPSYJ_34250 [Mycolicibacterium psychrotolerans]